jgi:membrane protease YdiL (CAAX protease family)
VPGILLTAVVFAFYHLKVSPQALLGKLVIGIVLGALRGRDRPLTAPAIAHVLLWAVLGTA